MPKNLQKPPKTYKNLQKPTKTSKNLQKPPKTYKNLQKPTKTYKNLQKPTKTYKNLQKPTKTSKNLQKPPKTSKNLQKPPTKTPSLPSHPVAPWAASARPFGGAISAGATSSDQRASYRRLWEEKAEKTAGIFGKKRRKADGKKPEFSKGSAASRLFLLFERHQNDKSADVLKKKDHGKVPKNTFENP